MRSRDRKNPGRSEWTPAHTPRWAAVLGLLASLGGTAAGQDLELSAPIGATGPAVELPPPALVKPPAPAPAPTAAPRRSVLALPGITTPTTPPPSARPSAELELPDLAAPVGMNQAPPPARTANPIVIEPLPSQLPAITEPSPTPGRAPVRRDPMPARSAATRTPTPPASTTARRPWWFGPTRPGPPPVNSGAATAVTGPGSNGRMPNMGRESVAEGKEGKADPAAEVALQKRLERQARALVGDRARVVEVRVSGKQVAIEARGVRMFQKRNVRRALETMPGLSGYRSSVSVLD